MNNFFENFWIEMLLAKFIKAKVIYNVQKFFMQLSQENMGKPNKKSMKSKQKNN
jgi:hypothetical protein